MAGRFSSLIATTPDDEGVAAVVGIALLLGVAVSAFAYALTTDLPAYGAAAEREWDALLATSAADLAMRANAHDAATTVEIPPAPAPQTLDFPLIGSAVPAPPMGAVGFDPACATATVTHDPAGGPLVEDLTDGADGCIRIAVTPVFTDSYTYVVEYGGLVREQDGRSVVLAGPAVDLATGSFDRFGLSLQELDGASRSVSGAATGVHVSLAPGAAASEDAAEPNAGEATLTFRTAHASAWKAWWELQFQTASVPGSHYEVACSPVSCAPDGTGRGTLVVTVTGPGGAGDDVAFAFSYGRVAVTLD